MQSLAELMIYNFFEINILVFGIFYYLSFIPSRAKAVDFLCELIG